MREISIRGANAFELLGALTSFLVPVVQTKAKMATQKDIMLYASQIAGVASSTQTFQKIDFVSEFCMYLMTINVGGFTETEGLTSAHLIALCMPFIVANAMMRVQP